MSRTSCRTRGLFLMRLAEQAGLSALAGEWLTVPGDKDANPGGKVTALVAGMLGGADSIDDMGLLRHGGMGRLFDRPYAPSTLGSFLRSFTFGHIRQLDAVAARLLAGLAVRTPLLAGPAGPVLAGPAGPVLVDVDDTIVEVHGYAKQGAGFGYSGVRGLNVLLATASTEACAPVIVAQRLRKGSANSARGAQRLVRDALATVRGLGPATPAGPVQLRADSAFYGHATIGAAVGAGAQVSVTVRMDPKVKAAIAGIAEDAWTPIEYPEAVFDEDTGRWISRAEVAEAPFTAFTSHPSAERVSGRLVVRRIPDLNRPASPGQGSLFTLWRFHAFFTTSALDTVTADHTHRGHAVIEQVNADLKLRAGPPALRPVHRQQRLAGLRGDGVQPHPRRRNHRRWPARQGHHRHRPAHPDHRPRPDRLLSAPADLAPACRVTLAASVGSGVHPHLRATRPCHQLTTAARPDPKPKENPATQAGRSATPGTAAKSSKITHYRRRAASVDRG
jgi:hypothetical protein